MANAPEMNYVVGRGRLFFDAFASPSDFTKVGERYFGDTSALSTTQANTDLKHYSSESGLKVLDRSVTLQTDTTGTFVCDNISPENLAFWYSGASSDYVQAAATAVVESITVQPGLWYQLGVTDGNPLGVTDLSLATGSAVVAVAATDALTFAAQPAPADTVTINGVAIAFGTTVPLGGNFAGTAQNLLAYINAHPGTLGVTASGTGAVLTLTATTPGVAGNTVTVAKSGANPTIASPTLTGGSAGAVAALNDDDWTIELATGRFSVPASGIIAPESVVTVTYSTAATGGVTVVTTETELYGALRFVSDNPVGANTDYYWPYVKLTSDGEYALKGDTWQQMSFSFEVLKLANQARVYLRQRAAA